MAEQLYMVFDVESVGLHGEGFAVGWVVVDGDGKEREAACLACPPDNARGNSAGRAWVDAQIKARQMVGLTISHLYPQALRRDFWTAWRHWAGEGAILVADCAWPVEANFLAAAVKDDLNEDRDWAGPYPLHEVATARMLAGLDPLATVPRLPDELPQHNPLNDARQSARLWLEALARLHLQALARD